MINVKFNLEKFRNGEIVVCCDKEEVAKNFLEYLDKNGVEWRSGCSLLDRTPYLRHPEKTYYAIEDFNGLSGLIYGSKVSSFKHGIDVVEWENLYNDFLDVGRNVRIIKGEDKTKGKIGKIKAFLPYDINQYLPERTVLIELNESIDGEKFFLVKESQLDILGYYYISNKLNRFGKERYTHADDVAKYLMRVLSCSEVKTITEENVFSTYQPFFNQLECDVYDNLAYEYDKKKEYGNFVVEYK